MRRITLTLAVTLGLCAPAFADENAPSTKSLAAAEKLREQAMAGNQAYELTASLTTDVGQRMAGSEGDRRAVQWAKAKFEALGFDRVELQPVSYARWMRRHESASLLSPYAMPLSITALGRSSGTNGDIDAEVMRFDDIEALKAADPAVVKGKIAFIDKGMVRSQDGHGYGETVPGRSTGPAVAAMKGAAALLIRSVGTDNNRLPHTGAMWQKPETPTVPAAALSVPDADQLARLLAKGPVSVRLNLDVGFDGEFESANVIGEITGSEKPDEFVVIGGHLDSWDLGTGAIDDASGVGITMAAGALIAALPERPRRSIRVVAFANEEQGVFGGRAFAEAGDADKAIIGAESDFGADRIYQLQSSMGANPDATLKAMADLMAPLGIPYDAGEGHPGADISGLTGKGMPFVALNQDGTRYFDYHHTANDTLDKIDPAALDQQVAAYAIFAWLAADGSSDFGRMDVAGEAQSGK
ncbi:MAG: M28 family peptidase [Rhodanobacteraceae bacterium]|nr:M28 family peptidase [Rhodanobacteraceae bacterium]HPF72853.1 M28 family peptidase [Xanthomonadaceae bacterium]HRX99094.1 M28 family peptidase [Xanthomonadaceae bacterium]